MPSTLKFSQFAVDGTVQNGDIIVGLRNGVNGQFTFNSSGGVFNWTTVAVNTPMQNNNGYIVIGGGAPILTLPTVSPIGSIIRVAGHFGSGWTIQCGAAEFITFGNVNTNSFGGGTVVSNTVGDCIELLCIAPDTIFAVLSSQGNLAVN